MPRATADRRAAERRYRRPVPRRRQSVIEEVPVVRRRPPGPTPTGAGRPSPARGRPGQRARRRDPRPAARRGRGLFLDQGYDDVSVRTINAAAGLNPGAVHYHFGSKQGLVVALLEDRLLPDWEPTARGRLDALGAATCSPMVDVVELAVDPLARAGPPTRTGPAPRPPAGPGRARRGGTSRGRREAFSSTAGSSWCSQRRARRARRPSSGSAGSSRSRSMLERIGRPLADDDGGPAVDRDELVAFLAGGLTAPPARVTRPTGAVWQRRRVPTTPDLPLTEWVVLALARRAAPARLRGGSRAHRRRPGRPGVDGVALAQLPGRRPAPRQGHDRPGREERGGTGPTRTILAPTPAGRRAVRRWLVQPVEHLPRRPQRAAREAGAARAGGA